MTKLIDRMGPVAVAILLLTSILIAIAPETGLRILWFGIVPLAPLIFFFATRLWVSVCPFSYIQSIPHRLGTGGKIKIKRATGKKLEALSWLLLFLLVPLRHMIFDTVGLAALVAIAGISAVSLLSGLLFDGLGGWCSSLCPVRPVEALYGQFTLSRKPPSHCSPCSKCTEQCSRLLNESKRVDSFRDFAAMLFPGFVMAFFLTDQNSSLLVCYLTEIVYMAVSGFMFSLLAFWFSRATRLQVSAILGLMLYYFLVIPRIFREWHVDQRLVVWAVTSIVLASIAARAIAVMKPKASQGS